MDLKGKTVLITGGTSGIGREAAEMLAQRGASLILSVRNIEEGNIVRKNLLTVFPQVKIEVLICNLSSLSSVKKFIGEVRQRYEHLDVLINNAGVFPQKLILSDDGYELNFAVNYLAPTLLSYGLVELLKKSPEARVINVASSMYREGAIDFGNFRGEHFDRYKSYAQSKLALIMLTKTFAYKLRGSNVTVNALHPGVIKTKLSIEPLQFTNMFLRRIFMMQMEKPKVGAKRIMYLATSPEVRGVNGEYFEKNKAVFISPELINDEVMSRLSQETNRFLELTK